MSKKSLKNINAAQRPIEHPKWEASYAAKIPCRLAVRQNSAIIKDCLLTKLENRSRLWVSSCEEWLSDKHGKVLITSKQVLITSKHNNRLGISRQIKQDKPNYNIPNKRNDVTARVSTVSKEWIFRIRHYKQLIQQLVASSFPKTALLINLGI